MTDALIKPIATLGQPPQRFTNFAVEAKYDGQRGIAILDSGVVMLLSRNGANITGTFPEITAALTQAVSGRPVVLDGEIVALDKDGVPSFSRLQQRWPQNRSPSAELLREVPVRFYAFDVLHLAEKDLTRRPYAERRAALSGIADEAPGRVIQFPCNWTDVDPSVVLAASAEMGLEGIVCKHLDSTYTPGLRSRDWIKTPHRKRSSFVIGGWLPGLGANRHTVGAILVGAHRADGRLHFCGPVGTGLSAPERRRLTSVLEPLRHNTSPFVEVPSDIVPYARWVQAEQVGDVEYREYRGSLRHPAWKGLRPDLRDLSQIVLPAS